ncbi:hypothetical protein HYDPIDRAFT_30644 [Hydnomerulius pinastri MD-312]|uniref:Uncharacterized protein n=1 Tax=Hydnomerulius pinastri MD-312 TaxID=994086 RepID=A0A0C9WD11_9AGAM|nr:hypothetical protein HYDPIDRAFT_30644 [Hydnomerulius pinastri MD-312]
MPLMRVCRQLPNTHPFTARQLLAQPLNFNCSSIGSYQSQGQSKEESTSPTKGTSCSQLAVTVTRTRRQYTPFRTQTTPINFCSTMSGLSSAVPRQNAATTTTLAAPEGWSNDLDDMDLDYYWKGHNGDLKATLATWYGLTDAQAIITRLPEFGDVMFLFQSGMCYYVWNGVEDAVYSIDSPTNLEGIYDTIRKLGKGKLGGLKMTKLWQKKR